MLSSPDIILASIVLSQRDCSLLFLSINSATFSLSVQTCAKSSLKTLATVSCGIPVVCSISREDQKVFILSSIIFALVSMSVRLPLAIIS
jgi:hypothetical protein